MSQIDLRLPEVVSSIGIPRGKIGNKRNELYEILVLDRLIHDLHVGFEGEPKVLSNFRVHVKHLIEKDVILMGRDIGVHL